MHFSRWNMFLDHMSELVCQHRVLHVCIKELVIISQRTSAETPAATKLRSAWRPYIHSTFSLDSLHYDHIKPSKRCFPTSIPRRVMHGPETRIRIHIHIQIEPRLIIIRLHNLSLWMIHFIPSFHVDPLIHVEARHRRPPWR